MGAVTVRAAVLTQCHKLCTELGLSYYMTTHFTERMNLRAPNQDEAFTALLKSVRFILSRKAEFMEQRIYVQIGSHHFFIKPEREKLSCLTYYFNIERPTSFADRKFALKA